MKLVTEMVQTLGDKYSRILDVSQYSAIQKYDLIGVGVTLMPNDQKQIIVGAPPIGGSPSAKAGLQAGDAVMAINGVPTRGRSAFDIIDQISDQPNAKTVTFTIQRRQIDTSDNAASLPPQIQTVTMDRQTMEVKDPVLYKVSETRSDGTKVGYIRISEFNALVKARLETALADLEQQGVNAYVLDLRMNTGGAFQSAVEISSLFLEDRIATYVVDGNAVELPFRTAKGRLAVDATDPLVLWIDGTSASASEVLAGALHDNCRAVTMGSKSFGKGLIQAVYGLKNGAGLVLTVAKYVTPSGSEIQGIGIFPDIEGGVPAPPIIPVLSTDTTQVNFKDIVQRLDSKVCRIPEIRGPASQQEQVQR
jgi:carboxyl-terminal processing protease